MEKSYPRLLSFVLFVFLCSGNSDLIAQVRIVGIVSDENNIPVENVSVSCPEIPEIVKTNSRGEYSIEVTDNCKVLHFDFNNSIHREKIANRSIINIKLGSSKTVSKTGDYRFNVMLNAGGTLVWGSISGSFLLTEFMSIDAGLGLGGIYGGTTFYFNSAFKNTNWQPFLSTNVAYFEEFMGPISTLVYIPAGVRYMNEKGTSISFEAGAMVSNNDQFVLDIPFWGGIKFGKYF